ncbi:MAG: hypothetical protein IH861_05180 [Chloroflexi bacterium]|nr:hypothetical protein [Chloroflexota bacterium]
MIVPKSEALIKGFVTWLVRSLFTYLWGHWSKYLTILTTVLIFAGLLGLTVDTKAAYVSILSAIAFLLLLGISFIRSIYELYRSREDLKRSSIPKLEIVKVTHSTGSRQNDLWGLEIRNLGTAEAENCRGQLLQLEFATDRKGQSLTKWPVNRYLQWSGSQSPRHEHSISIPAMSPANLEVVSLEATGSTDKRVYLAYADSDEFRKEQSLPGGYEILLLIGVTSKDIPPIYAVCTLTVSYGDIAVKVDGAEDKKLKVAVGFSLNLHCIRYERPDLVEFQQPLAEKLTQ